MVRAPTGSRDYDKYYDYVYARSHFAQAKPSRACHCVFPSYIEGLLLAHQCPLQPVLAAMSEHPRTMPIVVYLVAPQIDEPRSSSRPTRSRRVRIVQNFLGMPCLNPLLREDGTPNPHAVAQRMLERQQEEMDISRALGLHE